MRFLRVVGLVLLMLAGCSARLSARPSLPTAAPGISDETTFGTPAPKVTRTSASSGPTSTPAAWATPLPPTPLPPPPQMEHPVAENEHCFTCHTTRAYYALPLDHVGRSLNTCLGCHRQQDPDVSLIATVPHAVADREACLTCHLQGKNGAPPEPGSHAGRMNDGCLNCHKPK